MFVEKENRSYFNLILILILIFEFLSVLPKMKKCPLGHTA